jgi:hypothetical protein
MAYLHDFVVSGLTSKSTTRSSLPAGTGLRLAMMLGNHDDLFASVRADVDDW